MLMHATPHEKSNNLPCKTSRDEVPKSSNYVNQEIIYAKTHPAI